MLLKTLDHSAWDEKPSAATQQQAINALEGGAIVYLPALKFNLLTHEEEFLSSRICAKNRKNISFDITSNTLRGFAADLTKQEYLLEMMRRFAINSKYLLSQLFPVYDNHLVQARTSYRPIEIKGRVAKSYRKDDTRLHIDAFPANPTSGMRILRVFSNINPDNKPRAWKVGEEFSQVVQRFAPDIKKPIPGMNKILRLSGITKSIRTMYDHYMLNMHDNMKGDLTYQANVPQMQVEFPAGSTWCVYTDQVSHAALSGQYVLEQTFHLPVAGMQNKHTSPLRTLELHLNKKLL